MVGGSFKIYKGIVDLCSAKYKASEGLYVGLKETAFCSLRSQLLMALHDSGANELCNKVPTLKSQLANMTCLTFNGICLTSQISQDAGQILKVTYASRWLILLIN